MKFSAISPSSADMGGGSLMTALISEVVSGGAAKEIERKNIYKEMFAILTSPGGVIGP